MAIITQLASVTTTDATTTNVYTSPTALTAGFTIYVFAHEAATSDQQWFRAMASRSDGDDSVTVGTVEQGGDAGGSAWSIEVQDSGTDELEVNVTGEGSHTILWAAYVVYWSD